MLGGLELLLGVLQRCPVKSPPPHVGGALGGGSPPTAPPTAPLILGELKLPPRMGGVETPPISLITPFLCDINPV